MLHCIEQPFLRLRFRFRRVLGFRPPWGGDAIAARHFLDRYGHLVIASFAYHPTQAGRDRHHIPRRALFSTLCADGTDGHFFGIAEGDYR